MTEPAQTGNFRFLHFAAVAAASPLVRLIGQRTSIVFFSTLATHLSTFAVLAMAALVMPVTSFAHLSLIIATAMLATTILEFGLTVTSTKLYADTRDRSVFRSALRLRLIGCGLAASVAVPAIASGRFSDIGLGLLLGAVLNIWNGIRSTDQALEDYASFWRASLVFAVTRCFLGCAAAYATQDPLLTAICLFAVPVMVGAFASSARHAAGQSSFLPRLTRSTITYAGHVYINNVAFVAIAYLPQFIISSRLGAADSAAFGLILAFAAPVSLLVYSLRSVLMPDMMDRHSKMDRLLWSRTGLALIISAWLALMLGGAVIGRVLVILYGHSLPGIEVTFLIFFAGTAGTAMLGLYSLSVHVLGVPHIGSLLNVAKLGILTALLAILDLNLPQIAAVTAAVMILGELTQILILGSMRRSVNS